MPTLGQIVGQVRHRLSGAGAFTEKVSALNAPVGATDLNIPLVDAQGIGPSVVEVGFEQMRVRSASEADAELVLWPFGRGYNQSQASSHPAGAEVVVNPRWSASAVAAEVNGVLQEIYPALYSVGEFEAPYTLASDGEPFLLPAGAVGVVAVFVQSAGSGAWVRVDEWRFEPDAARFLTVKHAGRGEQVRVVFAARPGTFDVSLGELQDFGVVTGLPDRIADLLVLGVAYRFAPLVDLARVSQRSAEAKADQRDQGAGSSIGRLLFSEFQARLDQEKLALHNEHPIRMHKVR